MIVDVDFFFFNIFLAVQSSRKSSVSAAAPEVILTTPLDKDAGNVQSSEKPAADEKKVPAPKSLLQLLPVSQDNNLNCKILTTFSKW